MSKADGVGTKRLSSDTPCDTVTNKRSRSRTSTNETENDTNNNNMMTTTSSSTSVNWGEWMGSWKVGSEIDEEAERIDRQKAAFGGDTISRLKDLNVLILGCKGVGVETAKNLILTNVGGVLIWDNGTCEIADRGTNFYVTDSDITDATTTTTAAAAAGRTRAQASIGELQTLNPFCRVDVWEQSTITDEFLTSTDILNTRRPLGAVVVTTLLPKKDLIRINETCRANGTAFIMALTNGVTSSLFSDFGPSHEIADATGEPTQTLAVSNMEVLNEPPDLLQISGVTSGGGSGQPIVIVTVAQADHGLDDGDVVTLDDMRGELAVWNGRKVQVKRVAIESPVRTVPLCVTSTLYMCVCLFVCLFA